MSNLAMGPNLICKLADNSLSLSIIPLKRACLFSSADMSGGRRCSTWSIILATISSPVSSRWLSKMLLYSSCLKNDARLYTSDLARRRRTAHEIIPFTALHSHLPLASFTYQVKVVVVAMRCVQSTAVGLVCHARLKKRIKSEWEREREKNKDLF